MDTSLSFLKNSSTASSPLSYIAPVVAAQSKQSLVLLPTKKQGVGSHREPRGGRLILRSPWRLKTSDLYSPQRLLGRQVMVAVM